MKASEHLGKILEKIKATHWGQGSYVIEEGPHPLLCVLGLMHWTAMGDDALTEEEDWEFDYDTTYPAYNYLNTIIVGIPRHPEEEKCFDPECYCHNDSATFEDIVSFNDSSHTTRDNIAKAVEQAIELAKADGN